MMTGVVDLVVGRLDGRAEDGHVWIVNVDRRDHLETFAEHAARLAPQAGAQRHGEVVLDDRMGGGAAYHHEDHAVDELVALGLLAFPG
jgi:hypothetical protein